MEPRMVGTKEEGDGCWRETGNMKGLEKLRSKGRALSKGRGGMSTGISQRLKDLSLRHADEAGVGWERRRKRVRAGRHRKGLG